MSFYKDHKTGLPLTVYRGECNHPDVSYPKHYPKAMYFGDLETAHHYANHPNTGDYYTSRIYPAHLVMKRLFINQPTDPFLDLQIIINRLGRNEALRVAKRFAKAIEDTNNWVDNINAENSYKGVEDYLSSPQGDVSKLYFLAYKYFDSLIEVIHLRKLGYDSAIFAGSGKGSAGKPEYCVFDIKQVYSTISNSFLDKRGL